MFKLADVPSLVDQMLESYPALVDMGLRKDYEDRKSTRLNSSH